MPASAPMPANPMARDHSARSPIRARANPTPANAKGHRAVIATMRPAPRASTVTIGPGRTDLLATARGATAAKPARHLASPTRNLATRNFLAARRTVVRARILGRIVVRKNRGRSATPARPVTSVRAPLPTAQEGSKSEVLISRNLTSRVMTNPGKTAAAMSVRDFPARARIAPRVIGRFVSGRSSIVPARIVRSSSVRARAATPGRSIRAATRERARLFLFHKPRGLMTTHADPEGRPTVFDNLPEGLPRLISIGRLDFNTEGLLLLTNDGGLARALELPDTGWLRRYRVRAHGEVTQAQLDELKKGVEVDGVKYGSIDATLERDQGANVWLVFAIREGKNREVRNVMAHLGLEVNRLIRVSYGPFQLGELAEGQVEEVKTRVLREQLGEKIATLAGADFNRPMPGQSDAEKSDDEDGTEPRGNKPFKPAGKSGL